MHSVRCIFKLETRTDQRYENLYEERITLWRAENIDEAIGLAETEAAEYASDDMQYLGFAQAYALYESSSENGIEVFSLLRESNLDPKAYIDTYFDTGVERERKSCEN